MAFFRHRTALQFEILALRHQLGVLQRSVKRPKLTAADRFLWAWLSAVWADWQPRAAIMKPATVIGWHRKGFGLFWTWKIRRGRLGRPAVPADVRSLIRTMSQDNPLWGAPRIHGELLNLGIAVGDTSVSKYRVRHHPPRVPGPRHRVRRRELVPSPAKFRGYYHRSRTHLGWEKDSPVPRPIQPADMGRVIAMPEVGGLHHRYERRAA